MTHQIFHLPRSTAISSNLTLIPGAKVSFFLTTTSTPTNTYQDAARTTPHTNPVVADAAGRLPAIYLDPSIVYRITFTDSADVEIYPAVDPVNDQILSQASLGLMLYPRTAAEIAAGVTPTNYVYPEGWIDRYGSNTAPGTTDMTSAIQTAVNVAHAAYPGGFVYGRASTYRTTAAIVYPVTSKNIKFFCEQGAILLCDHTGDGIVDVVTNENYGGHTFEGWTLQGPNVHYPTAVGYTPTSVGAGINMSRDATTNIPAEYNPVLRDITIQGFDKGLELQVVIGLNCFGGFIRFNQYGVYVNGGSTNANHFFGTHFRENRKAGIYSSGLTGGSLANATANVFVGCMIETNTPYVEGAYPSGGSPPTNSTGIYLNNSYHWVFRDCYSENQAASIYLTGASKLNKFLNHRIASGTGRLDSIYMIGVGVYSNDMDIWADSTSLSEINVIADNADQKYNRFSGSGVNFVTSSVVPTLDYDNVKPSLAFANVRGYGFIRMPTQGYVNNPGTGTEGGSMEGIATATATLHARGCGEFRFGSNITGNTIITTIDGFVPGQVLVLTNSQATYTVRIDSGTINGSIALFNGSDVVFNAAGQALWLYATGDGRLVEIGRNFATPANAYVLNATVVEDRTLLASASATATNCNNVLAALINDLKAKGILS